MEPKIIPNFYINASPHRWKAFCQDKYEKSLLLFITGKCNLNCTNCFSITSRGNQEMTVEQAVNIVKANPSFTKIDLMGGEPLLHPQLTEMITELNRLNRQVSLYTNGICLDRLDNRVMPIRACVSFHEIDSEDLSRKPLAPIADKLEHFVRQGNVLKLVFLMDRWNAKRALQIVDYVDQNLSFVKKLTIGLMRYENDYWNDCHCGVLSFHDYAQTVQHILDAYTGRLSIDIFLKGVLDFGIDPGFMPNRTNRFKCVFPDNTYSSCLFTACDTTHATLPQTLILPKERESCMHTCKNSCLADKIRLINITKDDI